MAALKAVSPGACPKCGGSGYVHEKKRYPEDHRLYPGEEFMVSYQCGCLAKAQVQASIRKAAGLSPAFEGKTFKNFVLVGVPGVVREAYKAARGYVSSWDGFGAQGGGFLVLGASGSGKTHLICAITNELVKRGVRVIYFPYVEAVAEMRRRRFEDDWQAKRREALKSCDLLVIDDLFKSEPDKYAFELLFEVINDRYFQSKPVVVSSEYLPDELLEYDAAIAGRLLERARVSMMKHPDGDLVLNYRLRHLPK